jgi:hypothetical protein
MLFVEILQELVPSSKSYVDVFGLWANNQNTMYTYITLYIRNSIFLKTGSLALDPNSNKQHKLLYRPLVGWENPWPSDRSQIYHNPQQQQHNNNKIFNLK